MTDLTKIKEILPASIKLAIETHQTHKLYPESATMDKVAAQLGAMMANRKAKWQPIFEGLHALKELGG